MVRIHLGSPIPQGKQGHFRRAVFEVFLGGPLVAQTEQQSREGDLPHWLGRVWGANLVVKHIEAEGGLRLHVELPLKGPGSGVARLIANHLVLTILESVPEIRALCSAVVTRPRRSCGAVPLPP